MNKCPYLLSQKKALVWTQMTFSALATSQRESQSNLVRGFPRTNELVEKESRRYSRPRHWFWGTAIFPAVVGSHSPCFGPDSYRASQRLLVRPDGSSSFPPFEPLVDTET